MGELVSEPDHIASAVERQFGRVATREDEMMARQTNLPDWSPSPIKRTQLSVRQHWFAGTGVAAPLNVSALHYQHAIKFLRGERVPFSVHYAARLRYGALYGCPGVILLAFILADGDWLYDFATARWLCAC